MAPSALSSTPTLKAAQRRMGFKLMQSRATAMGNIGMAPPLRYRVEPRR